ncbi:MAG: hypothetical protein KDD34_09675, partial [Bdellovibrionales bacterium]|nr:hypothetical protein [Bdellovibrionales bacterium]
KKNAFRSSEISMADDAILYIPKSCQNGDICRLHIALHGCEQTIEDIDDLFFTKTGYNEWAESNNIIILYPQVRKSLPLTNPHGCWDWFGYSSKKFATKNAPQMQVIMKNIEVLSEKKFHVRSRYYK